MAAAQSATSLHPLLARNREQVLPAPTTTGDRKRWDFCLPRALRRNVDPVPADAPAGLKEADELRRSGSGRFEPATASGGAAVKVTHLRKTYPGSPAPIHAVVDLSFRMADGVVTGLLGQNGAGKTTAINVLCGLVQPTSGDAVVHGLNVRDDIDRVRALSGVCPQHDLLFDELTVKEHIELYAGIKGLDQAAAKAQVCREPMRVHGPSGAREAHS